jgi:hypothetical protein
MDKTAKYSRCEPGHYNCISSTDLVATAVSAIDFSPDGDTLYTASNDTLKSWNMLKSGLLIENI